MANKNLNKAKEAKKDEFYTQLEDINNELRYYREHFRGKTVLCNCDDPRVSNFFTYFAYNFEFPAKTRANRPFTWFMKAIRMETIYPMPKR